MTDRSNWPAKVPLPHARWVNQRLRELGEPRAYSEVTGNKLRYDRLKRLPPQAKAIQRVGGDE